MKNVYLYAILAFFSFKSFGQGVDVIFLIDNSLAVSGYPVNTVPPNTEYSDLYNSVQGLMSYVLECNPANRVTVVQHSDGNDFKNLVYVESDFSNTAFPFVRRYNIDDDLLHETVDFVSARLLGIPDTSSLGSGILLNRTPGNALVLYIFNDYHRDGLVDGGVSQPIAFSQFDNFKNLHGATIMLTHISIDPQAKAAAAAISSLGGSYTGAVESYSTDPYGSGATPRFYRNTNDYALSASEIQIFGEEICLRGQFICPTTLVLTSANNVASPLQDNRQAKKTITASNIINNGATGIYHAGDYVLLKHGFHSAGGSKFRGHIEECSNKFVGLRASEEGENLNFSMAEVKQSLFTLSPNPAADRTVIASDKTMAHVEVKSLTGTIFCSAKVNDKSHELYIGNYPKGFYMVMVTTDTGEVEVKKLIKD